MRLSEIDDNGEIIGDTTTVHEKYWSLYWNAVQVFSFEKSMWLFIAFCNWDKKVTEIAESELENQYKEKYECVWGHKILVLHSF